MIAKANLNLDSASYPAMQLNYSHNSPGSMPGTIAIANDSKPSLISLID